MMQQLVQRLVRTGKFSLFQFGSLFTTGYNDHKDYE